MMSMNVYVILPTDIVETINIDTSLNVQYLKLTIERNYGIPSELQTIQFNNTSVQDEDILDSLGIQESSHVNVTVDVLWNRLVGLCLKGNNPTLYRRVSVARQHVDETDRVFISLFISATRGFVLNLSNLLSNYTTFDLKTRTKVTGRTLLHAAVGSGQLEGLAAIKKNAGMGFERLLYIEDRWGTRAIDELRARNETMMHYINKFISVPRTADDVEQKNREVTRRGSQIFGKDTRLVKNSFDNKENSEKMKRGSVTSSCDNEAKNGSVAKLSRPKRSQGHANLNKGKSVNTKRTTPGPSSTGAPERNGQTNCGIKTNERTPQDVGNLHLPKIMNPTKPGCPGSPRSRANTLNPNLLLGDGQHVSAHLPVERCKSSDSLVVPTFGRARTPVPPSDESKKTPVAGILKNSNWRKFSSARKESTNLTLPTPTVQRAKSVEPVENLLCAHNPLERASSAGKVRRISLFQGPKGKTQVPSSPDGTSEGTSEVPSVDAVPVFTLEEGRIDRPWNVWIKAVSVDVESEEGKALLNSPPTERNRKLSNMQASAMHNEQEKHSFGEWCQYKEQEKLLQQLQLKEAKNEKERKELEARYKKHGKTFDEWLKTKQLYLTLLKQQQLEDERENVSPSKLLKGKTFEEWMKGTEEKEKNQSEVNKKQNKVKVEEQKVTKERRRKESTAKYQQWLADKEKQDIEKELKEFHALVNRKPTDDDDKPTDNTRRRRTSSMKQ